MCIRDRPYTLFLGTRAWDNKEFLDFVKSSPKLHIGYPAEQAASNETAMSQRFMEAFREKYGEDAEPVSYTHLIRCRDQKVILPKGHTICSRQCDKQPHDQVYRL